MVNYYDVIKKSKAYNVILKDKQSKRLSHTYILVSEDQDYALDFAKQMAITFMDLQNNNSGLIKIEKNIHPDVIIFGKEKKLMVADAETIVSDVIVRPFEGDCKIYILLNFDDANEETQNKLLKTIEEPPQSSYFIIATKSEKKLLQTVLSRGKKINLDFIDFDDIVKMFEQTDVDADLAKICASCASGVFSRAYKMAIDKEFMSLYENVFQCLKTMNSSRDVLKFASIFSSKDVNKSELADLFMLVVRDVMIVKSDQENLINNKSKLPELRLIASGFSNLALSKIIEYCLQLKEDLIYNTNSVSSVDEFLLKTVEAKVKCKT